MSTTDGLFTWDDVIRVARIESGESEIDPDLIANFSSEDQDWFIQQAADDINSNTWGFNLAYYGRIYYCAHNAVMSLNTAAGEGTTGSESIGGVSISKTMPVNNPTAEQGYLETIFGRKYYNYKQRALLNVEKFKTGVGQG